MSCPDPSVWAGAVGGVTDPALLRHLRECEACRRDLEIANQVRAALHPAVEVPAGLNARVMAAVRARAARLMRPASPLDLLISAVLVAAGGYVAAALAAGGDPFAPHRDAAAFAVICGIAGAWYHKRRSDRRARREDGLPEVEIAEGVPVAKD